MPRASVRRQELEATRGGRPKDDLPTAFGLGTGLVRDWLGGQATTGTAWEG